MRPFFMVRGVLPRATAAQERPLLALISTRAHTGADFGAVGAGGKLKLPTTLQAVFRSRIGHADIGVVDGFRVDPSCCQEITDKEIFRRILFDAIKTFMDSKTKINGKNATSHPIAVSDVLLSVETFTSVDIN